MYKYLLIFYFTIFVFELKAQETESLDAITALENNGKVYLKWIIKEGNTCNGIRVLRSNDSLNFINIGQISGICGSATEKTSYEFIDENPELNIRNYYTIEMGSLGFSKIISIDVYDFKDEVIVRPQPAKGYVQLIFKNSFNDEYLLQLLGLNGQIIFETSNSSNLFAINTDGLTSGFYVYKISNKKSGALISGKVLIQN